RAAFESLFSASAVEGKPAFAHIGDITAGTELEIRDSSRAAANTSLFSAGLDEMFASWRRPLDW
nr:hypothetical protein [Fibrobacterota bacterium]